MSHCHSHVYEKTREGYMPTLLVMVAGQVIIIFWFHSREWVRIVSVVRSILYLFLLDINYKIYFLLVYEKVQYLYNIYLRLKNV